MLLVVTHAAQHQRQPDQAVEGDHDYREHHVTRKSRIILPVKHRRRNHHHFNGDGGESQDQRSIGLAALDRQTISMPHD